MEELKLQNAGNILRKVPSQKLLNLKKFFPILVILIIVVAGVMTGIITSSRGKNAQIAQKAVVAEDNLSPDQKKSFNQTFRDNAEGIIQKNDKLEKYAQGSHLLIRPGGDDQTAFLTSTVLDLDQYIGKKVKIYGETFGSSQVGWLMDVGKVEAIN